MVMYVLLGLVFVFGMGAVCFACHDGTIHRVLAAVSTVIAIVLLMIALMHVMPQMIVATVSTRMACHMPMPHIA